MNITRTILLAACIVSTAMAISIFPALGGEYRFRRYSVDEGLSQSTVYAIAQDRASNIWLGTHDGLNMFDGYEFTIFKHDKQDSGSLPGNIVYSLYVDPKGGLWVGLANYIARYDYITRTFENYTLLGVEFIVYDMIGSECGQFIIIATDMGILSLDLQTGKLEVKVHLRDMVANTLCTMPGNRIMVGSQAGVYEYNVGLGLLRPVMLLLEGYSVNSIIPDERGGYWLAAYGNGLFRADAGLEVTDIYNMANSSHAGLMSDNVRTLCLDNYGKLWLGTYDGLHIFDKKAGIFSRLTHEDDNETSLSHGSIRSMLSDDQGGLWLGSFYGGVNYYHPLAQPFRILKHSSTGQSLSDNIVNCIMEDKPTGDLWIGTNSTGLDHYDIRTGKITTYPLTEASGSPQRSNDVKCLLAVGETDLYVGSHMGGLCHMDLRTKRRTVYSIETDIINNGSYALIEGRGNEIWAGTLEGLYVFDTGSKKFAVHPLAERITRLRKASYNTLFRDSRARVWMGTRKGLYVYNEPEDDIMSFADIRSSDFGNVLCVTEDRSGNIWIGTDQGLYCYDNSLFRLYTMAHGLPNDTVYGILEDELGRLWLSTNKGLSCFNYHESVFRNYGTQDGVASNQFNQNAYCRAGRVFYFGSINGISWFDPHEVSDNPFSPKVKITGCRLFNREIEDTDNVDLVYDDGGTINSIRISSRQNLLGINFVATNFLAGHQNTYMYRLEGFSDEDYYTTDRSVSFSNLSPGNYTFVVNAANNNGRWHQEPTRLDITVVPMWYETVLAKFLYILLAAALVFIFIRFNLSRSRMRMERRNIEEMSNEKIRFYINSSHELRTPLTLILSPLKEIMGHGTYDKFVRTRLEYIHNNSKRLLNMVNQLLDYRKAELGMVTLNVAMHDLESIVTGVFAMFENNAQKRDINFILDTSLPAESYPVDKLFIEQILINLISNAIRFTPDGGMIKVCARDENGYINFCVRDNGKGIPAAKLKHIFERFYQVNESSSGTGVGLSIVKMLTGIHHGTVTVNSREGEFTEFTVTIPHNMSAYSPTEISDGAHTPDMLTDRPLAEYSIFDHELYEPEVTPGPGGESVETILIVEDNNQIKRYLAEHFCAKFNVVTASDGTEALEKLTNMEPDIIITDLMMVPMNGIKLCQVVKQNIRTSHIPVIMITAKDTPADYKKGVDAGADVYLPKPFDIDILDGKVSNLLKMKYRLRQYYTSAIDVDPEKITSNSLDGELLRKAIAVVEKNLDNVEFSASDFSSELCMSRSNLHLKLKSITGESTTQFIRRIRINTACKLLTEGTYTISEISNMVGFNTPSYFSASFRKSMGCMPSEYVKGGSSKSNLK